MVCSYQKWVFPPSLLPPGTSSVLCRPFLLADLAEFTNVTQKQPGKNNAVLCHDSELRSVKHADAVTGPQKGMSVKGMTCPLVSHGFRPAKPSCLLSLYDLLCAGERIRRYSNSILQVLTGLDSDLTEVTLAA